MSGAAPEESDRRKADRAVARRCAAGDPVAQRALYDAHIERVERIVVGMIGGGADVADVVQDVFFRIFRSIARFRGDAELATWVSRITVNEVLELVGRVSGRRLRIERTDPQPGDARHTGADGTRAEALLGYTPQVTLEDGVAEEAAWVAHGLGLRAAEGAR